MFTITTEIKIDCHEDLDSKPIFLGDEEFLDTEWADYDCIPGTIALVPIKYDEKDENDLEIGGLPSYMPVLSGELVNAPFSIDMHCTNGILTMDESVQKTVTGDPVRLILNPHFTTNHTRWSRHVVCEMFGLPEENKNGN